MSDTSRGAGGPPSLPPHAILLQLIVGRAVSKALGVAAELNVADRIAAGITDGAALAEATGTHAPSLRRLLRSLAGLGVFREDEAGRWSLTPIGELLRSDVPGSMRPMAIFLAHDMVWRAWSGLGDSVRLGGSAFERIYEAPVFEYLAQHPSEGRIFDEAMTSFAAGFLPAILAAYDFSGVRTVVDVGGGRGHLLAAILKAYPQTSGVLIDIPPVAEGARAFLRDEGVDARSQVVAGDFFASALPQADMFVLKHVLHDWDDAGCTALLKSCAQSMSADARLLIVEMILPPPWQADRAPMTNLLDLEMLVTTPGGKERTEDEYRALLAGAGLRLTRSVPTQSLVSILEAQRA